MEMLAPAESLQLELYIIGELMFACRKASNFDDSNTAKMGLSVCPQGG
jgi:hypothetical protein